MHVAYLILAVPILALMIPIVAIMSAHQHRMASLINRQPDYSPQLVGEVESLRREVQELKQLVHQQLIAMDGRFPQPPVPPTGIN